MKRDSRRAKPTGQQEASSRYLQIIENLEKLESNGDTTAVGDEGRAKGVLQIHRGAVEDVNRRCGTNYRHDDMFSREASREVFVAYMEIAEEQVEKADRKADEEDLVRSWNGGAYKGWCRTSTDSYWEKYKETKTDKTIFTLQTED